MKNTNLISLIVQMLKNNEPNEKILSTIEMMMPSFKKDELFNSIMSCKLCKDSLKCNPVPFIGNMDADIMLVGESPGEHEVLAKMPFIGASGQLLDRMLENAEEKINERWNKELLYITNTIKCRSVDDNNKNRDPSIFEIAMCNSYIEQEIELVKPKLIICLGSIAANKLIHPDFKITQNHGVLYGNEVKTMAIYHPSHVLHVGLDSDQGKQLRREMWADLLKANEYLDSLI